ALKELKSLLEDRSILKVAQNVKFAEQLFALRKIDLAPLDDVMLISYVLDAGRNAHGTAALSERLLGHQTIEYGSLTGSGKSAITFEQVPIDRAGEYAAEDADVTLLLVVSLTAPRRRRTQR